ncbi:MAG: aldo/keto reductase [Pseudomonadales bacterium]
MSEPNSSSAASANGYLVLGAWLATCVLGYIGLGGWLQERIEGIDPASIPLTGLIAFVVSALVSLVLTFRWARRLRAPAAAAPEPGTQTASGRRKFLTGAAVTTGGVLGVAGATVSRVSGWTTVTGPALGAKVVATDPNPKQAWHGATVQAYRPLGKTGLMVSDVSIGSTRLHQNAEPEKFLNAMLDRGVNYIDASPDYAPQSEVIIKAGLAGRDRSKLVIASKFCTGEGHVRQGSDVADYINAIEGCLTRMGTDYIDVAHIHSCDSTDRLMDDNVHEAFDRLKQQGKVRFMGVSTHTPNLETVANTAIDSGRFDVMMLAYHHGAWPNQVNIIERAAQAGMGIVAMKTLKGAKHKGLAEFRPESDTYAQAAFKWVLSNPNVANLVVSVYENQHMDEYLFASGQAMTVDDIAVLEKYDQLIAGTHCFQHCGACLDTCPAGIPIHDVLRHRMYFEDYGDQKQAMQLYSKLATNADACLSCSAPCLGACPEGVPIRERMLGAHEMLTIT